MLYHIASNILRRPPDRTRNSILLFSTPKFTILKTMILNVHYQCLLIRIYQYINMVANISRHTYLHPQITRAFRNHTLRNPLFTILSYSQSAIFRMGEMSMIHNIPYILFLLLHTKLILYPQSTAPIASELISIHARTSSWFSTSTMSNRFVIFNKVKQFDLFRVTWAPQPPARHIWKSQIRPPPAPLFAHPIHPSLSL